MGFNPYQWFQKEQGLPYVEVLSISSSATVFCPRESFIPWSQCFSQCKMKNQNAYLCELQYLSRITYGIRISSVYLNWAQHNLFFSVHLYRFILFRQITHVSQCRGIIHTKVCVQITYKWKGCMKTEKILSCKSPLYQRWLGMINHLMSNQSTVNGCNVSLKMLQK